MAICGEITTRDEISYVYEWRIDNFLQKLEANEKHFSSPNISIIDNNGKNGTICLLIGNRRTETNVSVFILDRTKEELELTYRWGPY